jgi:hypothetical protein
MDKPAKPETKSHISKAHVDCMQETARELTKAVGLDNF